MVEIDDVEDQVVGKLCQYARPIADAFREPHSNMSLLDPAMFLYAVETFEFYDRRRLEETLLMLLDEFSRLDQSSYCQLYLWCIVELSRMDPAYTAAFWPLVVDLDLRYRSAPWQRPAAASLLSQPYRLTELVFHFYKKYTHRRPSVEETATDGQRIYPTLGMCLTRIKAHLGAAQRELVIDTLRELERSEQDPDYGDARGLLLRAAP